MTNAALPERGAVWLAALTGNAPLHEGYSAALRVCHAPLADRTALYVCVVPDPANRFPRARNGETGLVEGWEIARAVQRQIAADRGHEHNRKTPIVAVIDVPSQAYGRREEAFGIHQSLAAAAAAYAEARLAGHPVIGLLVGKAISGAFLAHGYQANRLIAFRDEQVQVHAMGKESAARITMRSVDALEELASKIPPMAYDIDSFASLGLLWRTLQLRAPDTPAGGDLALVQKALEEALADILASPDRSLHDRLGARNRQATVKVRTLLREQWRQDAPQQTRTTETT
ncbi:MAG TPA: biotin-independent malonate decarboxylase subunit gamma [Oxalicibacterium sp.]|nr:biotin-independent malonate decarboxylase subunit gamma [Oxalicibacterium sp.]